MGTYKHFFLFLCFIFVIQVQIHAEQNNIEKTGSLEINLTNQEITDNFINLSYQIKNTSNEDIWLCEACDFGYDKDYELFLDEDGQTIVIRRRTDIPLEGIYRNPPLAQYVRLRKGQTRSESILCTFPINLRPVFTSGKNTAGIISAKRIEIEIGYYPGSIIDKIKNITNAESLSGQKDSEQSLDEGNFEFHFFNNYNKSFEERDEKIRFYALDPQYTGELVLRTSIENLNIPYSDEKREKRFFIDISEYTKLEFQFNPSMLEYFYPFSEQQNLLNTSEKEYLTSLKTLTLNDINMFNDFNMDIRQAMNAIMVSNNSNVKVTCYKGNESLDTFIIYNNGIIESGQERFGYYNGFDSIREIASKTIQPYDLRMQCANNLKNLWYCIQLYNIAQNAPADTKEYEERMRNRQSIYMPKNEDLSNIKERVYPKPDKWTDSILNGYRFVSGLSGDGAIIKEQYTCPSTKGRKCNYAMNPNCKPDSQADMVLLFETKDGWNKYGGPELFTFDNHDPEGGCVLLNDGTVKFIRTKDELNSLKWK